MSGIIYTHKDFIENKYHSLYFKIITNRKSNIFEGYTESHHIIPASMGGEYGDNMVSLSAREHFICHYLLTKFTKGQAKYKMASAFSAMSMKHKYTNKRYINSKLYESVKPLIAQAVSAQQKLIWQDPEYKAKMTEAAKASWANGSRDKQLEFMKDNSPFKDPKVHAKTMKTRAERGTNVFVTNNPMHNEKSMAQKLKSMPDMKGRKAWFNTLTQERRQCVDMPDGEGWILRGHNFGIDTKAKGKPKPKFKCKYCEGSFAAHRMNSHVKAKHNGKD